ncbi:MAG: type II toxin-antitoxin system VapC family toxin [Gemmatimonadota bacterium]|nr:type II toxin-antitoxin system VapC family toxin [Gemmatimonadota bacterium]
MEIVIDTSALLAVVGNEPEKATLITLTKGASLVAPASVHWEVGNALSAMFKRRRTTLHTARQALVAYSRIAIRFVDVPLEQAVELSSELRIYAYDAYIIACAMNRQSPLLSLDKELSANARLLGLNVLTEAAR